MPDTVEKFQFNAGSLCLDFLATIDSSDPAAKDLLTDPSGLGQWLDGPGLPAPVGGMVDSDLVAARELRAAIDRTARARLAGRTPDASDVRCINLYASRPTPVYLLRAGARSRTLVEQPDVTASLSVIARDAVRLFTDPGIGRLRECERVACSRLFLDRSPSGGRRWCSMKGCGEMVASATYRRRHMTEQPK